MQISILEPKGTIWEGNAKKAILPTSEGEICVLDFHQAFLIRLARGNIQLSEPDFARSITDGIAFMQSNVLRVFAET